MREIKILKSLKHSNIVQLKEIVVGKKPDSIFLVFEYCEHDFAGQQLRRCILHANCCDSQRCWITFRGRSPSLRSANGALHCDFD